MEVTAIITFFKQGAYLLTFLGVAVKDVTKRTAEVFEIPMPYYIVSHIVKVKQE